MSLLDKIKSIFSGGSSTDSHDHAGHDHSAHDHDHDHAGHDHSHEPATVPPAASDEGGNTPA
jgi:hypothetical protein